MTRWEQRLVNYNKQLNSFEDSLVQKEFSELELSGLVQQFNLTIELAWKTLKDYLYENGTIKNSPREVIKESFSQGIISDGHVWLRMLDARNNLIHSYDIGLVRYELNEIINVYFHKLIELRVFFENTQSK